jgi:hypothetical protein
MDSSYFYKYGFDRIDFSNISDNGWKGTKIVTSFAPFLKQATENPYASILTLYLKIFEEECVSGPRPITLANIASIRAEVLKLMPLTDHNPANPFHRAHSYNEASAASWFLDHEDLYKRFCDRVLLPAGKSRGLKVKENNTIMKK